MFSCLDTLCNLANNNPRDQLGVGADSGTRQNPGTMYGGRQRDAYT